ncbi:hypothetical protein [Actinomycetospora sp. NBRC 106378]|uniref:hypothetical protein n=1 Tax=Actinomycetospora sp. NBRC 106378 TaxID=3032208 RepID=UPI00249FFC36|nr:hypothetical protein [Actinomycetospora sp. NBRC 106378]GLZ53221.1 hypothetical protein Acsp07_28380 [Actinomycetospora sp. NBRC 106378]
MTAETNQGARRRVVPMQPVDAPTDVLPVVGAARPTPRPTPTPGPAAPRPPAPVQPAAPEAESEQPEQSGKPERRAGMGLPALVLGVLAAGTAWSGWAGVVLGLFAAVAGFLGARRAWRGLATDGAYSLGGLVLGAVGLVWGAVVVSQSFFGGGAFGDGLTLDQCLSQATSSFEMHMCKSQHITEFNQRFPDAAE